MKPFEALQFLGLSGKVSNADIKMARQRKVQQFCHDKNPAGEEMAKLLNNIYDLVKELDDIEVPTKLTVETNNMNTIHHRIYNKLNKLIPNLDKLEIGNNMKALGSSAMMDLSLDILMKAEDGLIIALSHYYKHEKSGDLIPDPDMEIAVYPSLQIAEALTYQDIFGYQSVHTNPSATLRKDLNDFLNGWLRNCLRTGHELKPREKKQPARSLDLHLLKEC